MIILAYLGVLVALALYAPAPILEPGDRWFAFALVGGVGVWRYSWYVLHLGRSIWYRRITFAGWRRLLARLDRLDPQAATSNLLPPEVFLVITTYRIPPETTALVYRAAIEEAVAFARPATLVAAVVEMADERLVKAIFARLAPPNRVRLVLVRTRGTGKRDGLAMALRAIARSQPQPGSAVVLQDGDTVLPRGGLARSLPFFALMPDVAGLTTDEDCVLASGGRLLHAWHRLRFARRHLLMCSHGLSRRLLTLTGRMSAFRVEVATDASFIEIIRDDALDHWRLGRFPLLTGEDKSTAYWVLRHGLRMIYVPDVKVVTIEHPPARGLPAASTKLMLRWFGNMLRASGRCIALGPMRLGLFTWWCFVDQRISMWTPLIGPLTAGCIALRGMPGFLWAYLIWVMWTRLLQTLALLSARPRIDGLWPFLIYYNQVWGALVKSWILFRLDRQRWTRQNIALERPLPVGQRRRGAIGSLYLQALALLTLATAVAFWSGLLAWPHLIGPGFSF